MFLCFGNILRFVKFYFYKIYKFFGIIGCNLKSVFYGFIILLIEFLYCFIYLKFNMGLCNILSFFVKKKNI